MTNIYGYFDDPSQEEPVFDPGLSVCCPACDRPLRIANGDQTPLKTISVMLESDDVFARDTRSYFYRVHKACYESLLPDQQNALDWPIVDARARLRDAN